MNMVDYIDGDGGLLRWTWWTTQMELGGLHRWNLVDYTDEMVDYTDDMVDYTDGTWWTTQMDHIHLCIPPCPSQ